MKGGPDTGRQSLPFSDTSKLKVRSGSSGAVAIPLCSPTEPLSVEPPPPECVSSAFFAVCESEADGGLSPGAAMALAWPWPLLEVLCLLVVFV